MNDTLARIQRLVAAGHLRVSDHGDEQLQDDRIAAREAVTGLVNAEVLERYSDTGRGPSILTLQRDNEGDPIHVVWAIAYNQEVVLLVTAYRPDPHRWHEDWRKRRR